MQGCWRSNGLKSHIQFKHPKIWDAIVAFNTPTPKTSSASSSTVSSKLKHQTKMLSHYSPALTLEEKKQMYLGRVSFWTIDKCIPFTMVGEPSFRGALFELFSVNHDKSHCAESSCCSRASTSIGQVCKGSN
jgi:hypothetical protein